MLALELGDLKDMEFDLSLTGFSTDEINALLTPTAVEGLTDEDAVPEIPENPVTKLGDVWVLGKHRLMCGDSTSVDAVEQLMDGTYPDLIHTDPPYGMNAVSKSSVLKQRYKVDIIGDDTAERMIDWVESKGYIVDRKRSSFDYDYEPGERDFWPRIRFNKK